MRFFLLFAALAAPALAQYDAPTLRGMPPCSAARLTRCIPRTDANGLMGIGTAAPASFLTINSPATPSNGQFRVTANDAGVLSGLTYAADNVAIGMDVEFVGTGWIPRSTSASRVYKTGAKLKISGDAGLTPGTGYTPTDRFWIDLSTGGVGIGIVPTISGTGKLHATGNTARVHDATRTPATAAEACNIGESAFDASFAYFCVAANTWKRVAIATW
jgi:hypothetical protein